MCDFLISSYYFKNLLPTLQFALPIAAAFLESLNSFFSKLVSIAGHLNLKSFNSPKSLLTPWFVSNRTQPSLIMSIRIIFQNDLKNTNSQLKRAQEQPIPTAKTPPACFNCCSIIIISRRSKWICSLKFNYYIKKIKELSF